VNIVFHAHHADVTEALQQRAEQCVRKLATRLRGATGASIRFTEDGALRRVELTLRAARRRPMVALGSGPRFEAALAEATDALEQHVAHARAARERRLRRAGVITPVVDATAAVRTAGVAEDVEHDDTLFGDLPLDRAVRAPRRAAGA